MTWNAATDLAAYRAALHAADVLRDLLQSPPWLIDVHVAVEEGQPLLVAVITSLNEEARVCIPTVVNNFRVQVDARSRG
jgi:hypothetical protein